MADDNVAAKTWRDTVKSHYPDRQFADDEEIGGAADELIQGLLSKNTQMSEANQKLVQILQSEPAIADFLADIIRGASLPEALARNFNAEDFTPVEGDPDFEAWDNASKERKAKNDVMAQRTQELDANKVESSKVFEQFREKMGMSEDEVDAFAGKIDAFLDDIYNCKVTLDFLDAVYKATNYENDLTATRNAALVEGKNTAIEEKKAIRPKGDGMPQLNSSSEIKEKPKKEPDIFDRASDGYKQRKRF